MATSESLTASVEGDVAEVVDVLRITAIRLHYRLAVDDAGGDVARDAVDRALESYADKCPAYQSVRGCLDCSWALEIIAAD